MKRIRMSEPESYPKFNQHGKARWERFLTKYIEPDFGLMDRLLSYRLLSEADFLAINSKGSAIEKNEAIVKWILRKNCYPEFLDVLKETNQSHLVNYLTRK